MRYRPFTCTAPCCTVVLQTADELVERDFGSENEKQPYKGEGAVLLRSGLYCLYCIADTIMCCWRSVLDESWWWCSSCMAATIEGYVSRSGVGSCAYHVSCAGRRRSPNCLHTSILTHLTSASSRGLWPADQPTAFVPFCKSMHGMMCFCPPKPDTLQADMRRCGRKTCTTRTTCPGATVRA